MTDAPELKPCPFCGGAAGDVLDYDHSTAVWLGCYAEECAGFRNWYETLAEGVDAWNTRADLLPQRKWKME